MTLSIEPVLDPGLPSDGNGQMPVNSGGNGSSDAEASTLQSAAALAAVGAAWLLLSASGT